MYGLILFSLLLNVVCFYFLFVLWKKLQERTITQDTTVSEDVGELLELFSQEMKEENARLHEMILQFSKQNQKKHDSISIQEEAEHVHTDLVENIDHLHSDENKALNKVLLLAQQGYNAEEIAKMLNRGKGEVELLLKFYA
ncbi:hypothetical protein P8610_15465 [Fictibacillus sp. UD]|uniref:DUF6115 domain-containing protein n=1 Tax=Fictibacillus sp. UD TaxID=3038777 RepID=UPI0037450C2D